jgi:hypothetical protein
MNRIKVCRIALIFSWFLIVGALNAQTFSARLSAIPASDGAEFKGNITASWNRQLSSSIQFFSDSDTIKEPIEGFDGSLLASSNSIVEITAKALEYRFDLGRIDIEIGAGARYYRESVDEDGVFELDSNNQQFDNDYSLSVYGPDIGTGIGLYFHPISIDAGVSISPIAWYNLEQNITIEPLISTAGSESNSGRSRMMTDLSLNLGLFDFLSLRTDVKSVEFDMALLGLGVDGADFVFTSTPTNIRSMETTVIGSVQIKLKQVGTFLIGGGYRWSSARDLINTDNTIPTQKEPIFSFQMKI